MSDKPVDIGPFRLEECIGRGGMGTVWLARHRAQDVRVAIKVLTPRVAAEPHLLAAFRNEVRAVAALHHRNVVMVLDHGELPDSVAQASPGELVAGAPYLVMEYADHGSLAPLRGRLPWPRVKQVLLALLDALAHAHARGVIHRDLKPANVLLTGRNLRVKLTDFGLVHLTQSGKLGDPSSEEPIEAGTPPYMAPEQLQGEWRDCGPWTDLYALGNLAWALVCGSAPLNGLPLPVVYYRIITRRWPEFEPLIGVPDGLQAWIMRLLEADPADRFQRAADAAWALMALPDDLDEHGDDEPTLLVSDAATPWESVTLEALSTLDTTTAALLLPDAALPQMPPLPSHWQPQVSTEPPSMRLVGAGLGLFGLRTVPFVGRQGERDLLWKALSAVRSGEGPQVVLIRGPAGIGRSRLCGWISHRAHEVGSATVLSARHDEEGGPEDGLGPMLLRWHQVADLDREALQERLTGILSRVGITDPVETRALLDYVAPGPTQDERSTAAFPSMSARHAVLARHIERLTRERSGVVRPIVLRLDDVQHSPETLHFLVWLLERQAEPRLPILVLATIQDDAPVDHRFQARLLETLSAHPRATTIELGPLPPSEGRTLVQQLVGLDDELAELVAERVGGNPLFAVQLIGDWVQRGVLVVGPRGFVVRDGEEVPDDLREVWAHRVDQVLRGLGKDAVLALELAAVLGVSVHDREWAAACKRARLTVPPELVERLAQRRLAQVDEAGWSFVHGMFRAAILQRAQQSGRLRSLHSACLAALRAVWAPGTPGLDRRLAHHATEAGRHDDAVKSWMSAAREAIDRGDPGTAEELCQRVSTMLHSQDVPPDDPRWLRTRCVLARALQDQGQDEASEQIALEVGAAARRTQHLGILADCLAIRGFTARTRGNLSVSRSLLREAVDLYVGLHKPLGLAECLLALGAVCRHLGDPDDAMSLLGRARDLFARGGSDFGEARALLELGHTELVRGQLQVARAHLRDARRHFHNLGAREGLGLTANLLGLASLRSGDLVSAEAQLARARERLAEIESPRKVLVDLNIGRLARERGDRRTARMLVADAFLTLDPVSRPLEAAACHAELLACEALARDWGAYDAHLSSLLALLERLGSADPEIALAVEQAGEIARLAGDQGRARAALDLSLAQWSGVGRRLRALTVKRRLQELVREGHTA